MDFTKKVDLSNKGNRVPFLPGVLQLFAKNSKVLFPVSQTSEKTFVGKRKRKRKSHKAFQRSTYN